MYKSIFVVSSIAALTFGSSALAQQRGMSEMDTDGNGTIEKSEFTAMLEKRFAETDTNGGGISMEEYTAKAEADRAERQARREARRAEREENREEREAARAERNAERLKARFDRMDADGNGTISQEEYSAAGDAMFDRMDRNDDGILNDRRGRGERRGRDNRSQN